VTVKPHWVQSLGVLVCGAGIALGVAGCDRVFGLIEVPDADGGMPNAYACACTCQTQQAAPEVSVGQSSDDAEENAASGAVTLNGSTLQLTKTGSGEQVVGLRFQNVQIPKGVPVTSAYIQFTASNDGSDPTTSLQWVGEASDNAATFTGGDTNVSNRPLTVAVSNWSPGPWVDGEAGVTERTSDLTAILNEIVSRPGWATGNAVVLVVRGTGDRQAVSFDGNAGQAPRLVVSFATPGSAVSSEVQVCMPADLNPSLNGGTVPTSAQLAADCSGRVQSTLGGLNGACGYPSACSCAVVLDTPNRFADSCTTDCAEVPLDTATCSNFDPTNPVHTATNAPGGAPVCAAFSPLSAELFGQQSLCEVTGTASFASDDESKTTPARGQVTFTGRPCPGGACAVGMNVSLDADPITFSNFFGSATFRNLTGVGESLPGGEAMLDASGAGAFGPDSLSSAGRGSRGSEGLALVGKNGDPLPVAVDWAGKACSLSGTLVGSVNPELRRCENAGPSANAICTDDSNCTDDDGCTDGVCNCLDVGPTSTTVGLTVNGMLVNQPPSIQAAPDQVVECNAAGLGEFTLASTASDPDGNAAIYTWFRGGRTGPVVGWATSIPFAQPVGTTQSYLVQVIDAYAQADADTTQVQVVDTTPPLISCNTPPTIPPGSSHPQVFSATASDTCDPTVVPTLSGAVCFKINGSGKKVVDMTHACDVALSGNTVRISHTNGMGEHIRWTASVTDASGNLSSQTCETVVGH
jgi:hypothetical protein